MWFVVFLGTLPECGLCFLVFLGTPLGMLFVVCCFSGGSPGMWFVVCGFSRDSPGMWFVVCFLFFWGVFWNVVCVFSGTLQGFGCKTFRINHKPQTTFQESPRKKHKPQTTFREIHNLECGLWCVVPMGTLPECGLWFVCFSCFVGGTLLE